MLKEKFEKHNILISLIISFIVYYLLNSLLFPHTWLKDFLLFKNLFEPNNLYTFWSIFLGIITFFILPLIVETIDSFLIFFTTPIFTKRWKKFKSLKRGYYSFLIIVSLFVLSWFSELLINNRAVIVKYQGKYYFDTLFKFYSSKTFGFKGYGMPDYRNMPQLFANQAKARQERIKNNSASETDEKYANEWGNDWALLPLYPFGPYETLLDDLPGRPPHPPSWLKSSWRINFWDEGWYQIPESVPEKYTKGNWASLPETEIFKHMALSGELELKDGFKAPSALSHILGTDDRGRDVFARMVYGFRISIAFALIVTFICYSIGISIGALLGYYGGTFDIIVQRFVEIWSAMPFLYTVMIISAIRKPTFSLLVFILCMFGWMGMTYYIRGEFFREKSKDYVSAATAIGCSDSTIIFRHILPNSLTPVISFMPFAIVGNISSLVSLDFLGFGLPAPTSSWGELIGQGLANLTKPWLVLSPMGAMFLTLLVVSFVGEAIREAFDPKEFSRLR
jgi:ABC-type microcin C transport system permease subunit YejE